jgi:hypothetical protein
VCSSDLKSVKTSRESTVTVLWNLMQTDRTNPNNKKDIIIVIMKE